MKRILFRRLIPGAVGLALAVPGIAWASVNSSDPQLDGRLAPPSYVTGQPVQGQDGRRGLGTIATPIGPTSTIARDYDLDFLNYLHQLVSLDLKSANLGADHSENAAVQAHARKVINTERALDDSAQQIARDRGRDLAFPRDETARAAAKDSSDNVDRLTNLSGPTFDREWLRTRTEGQNAMIARMTALQVQLNRKPEKDLADRVLRSLSGLRDEAVALTRESAAQPVSQAALPRSPG